jgi:hypothetical protein
VGTYRFVAAYGGDANNPSVSTLCNDPNESVTVNRATPELETRASEDVTLGGTVKDTAALFGAVNPTGTITFRLFGPNNASCAGTPVFTSTVAVHGNGTYSSASFKPTAVGTYRFVAAYGGDANNPSVSTLCNDPNESVSVSHRKGD